MQKIIELEISSYALLTLIGIVVAVFFVYCRSEIFKLKLSEILVYCAIMVVGMGAGSRVVFVISQIPAAIRHGNLMHLAHSLISGGFVFYGGLFGAVLAVWLIARVRKQDSNALMNYCTPAFPIFHFFGRIGCFMAGCCYGVIVDWGIILPEVDDYPRLPVQLFESVYNLIIVTVLMIYENAARKKNKKYSLLTVYLAMYAPFRFINEFFRGDALRGAFGPLSTSQWISLIVIITLAVQITVKTIKNKKADKSIAKSA